MYPANCGWVTQNSVTVLELQLRVGKSKAKQLKRKKNQTLHQSCGSQIELEAV